MSHLSPEIAQELYRFVNDQEQAVAIMKSCQSVDQVRSGLTSVADILQKHPGQDALVRSLLVSASPDGLDDHQVLQLRQTLFESFTAQSRSLRQSLDR